jgi:hypothetical protein
MKSSSLSEISFSLMGQLRSVCRSLQNDASVVHGLACNGSMSLRSARIPADEAHISSKISRSDGQICVLGII